MNELTGIYGLSLSQTNDYVFTVATTSGITILRHSGYELNQWHSVVGVKQGSILRLYVDGELVEEGGITGSLNFTHTDLLVGSRLQLPSSTFKGKIDDIQIYDQALSEANIELLTPVRTLFSNREGTVYPNPTSNQIFLNWSGQNLLFINVEL